MAPISFKDMISVDYRPGEPEEIKYYAHKRRKQYHGNESKDIDELSMKRDRKLPNLKIPVKGKKGVSKFMRKKAIGQAKDDLNASVQSADRKPEKYIKPDGKVGIRMVKTDKEVIKKEQVEVNEASLTVKDAAGGMSSSDKKRHAQMVARHGAKTKYSGSDVSYHGTDKQIQKALHIHHPDKDDENRSLKYHKSGQHGKDYGSDATHTYREEVEVDEALTLQQRMKRSRLMKRMKARIKIGRDRARRKMANKGKLERRAMRQARAQIAKKLTRGIPKGELSFARKQEIEKRLDKPALKQRIKRIAKRIFKDVRKKEVQRKKG